MFGSVHLLGPDRSWETPALDRAIAQSDELWLELPDPDDHEAAGAYVRAHGLDPARGLRRALDPVRTRALARDLASVGAPADALDGMQPWLAALTLSVAPLQRAGFETGEGVDRVVKRAAEARGEPVRGFETMESQLALLSDLPPALQVAVLDDAIDGFPKAVGDIRAIRAAWMAGDDARLYRLMKTGTPDAVFDRLFTERNGLFASAIDTRVRAGPGSLLVVVGAGHLVGPDGLVARLKALGFTVSRE